MLDGLRPISLLPVISKVFERIIKVSIHKFTLKQNIIPLQQFGFRENHSTIHAIHKLVADINWNLLGKKMTGAVLVDLRKAFDSVWHDGLMYKLKQKKMKNHLLKMILNMITGRKFKVTLNGITSCKEFTLTKGLQQGTVNSPTLFNIFTSELMKLFNLNQGEIESIAFADDQIIYTSDRILKKIQTRLQGVFEKVINWYKIWKLGVNSKKCETILFRNTLRKEHEQTKKNWKNFQIKDNLNNIQVPHKRCVKYLGIHLDDLLRYNQHVNIQIEKAKKAFRSLHGLFYSPYLSKKAKTIAYLTIIRPIITYGCPIWWNVSACTMERLRLFERRILRAWAAIEVTIHTFIRIHSYVHIAI